MATLSRRQAETLAYVQEYLARNGYAPSLREVAQHLGVRSVATVHQHMRALEDKGYVMRDWNKTRAIVPVDVASGGAVTLPLLGRIPASPPAEALLTDDEVEVPANLIGIGDHFGLTVSGESMMDDGIRDGDIVIVRRQQTAHNGETVAVLLDGEVTLKKLDRADGRVMLRPANAAFAPIEVTGDLEIQGVVVALLRKYA